MTNHLEEGKIQNDYLCGMDKESFDKLDKEEKNIIITANKESFLKEKDSGIIGKFLGANTCNASIHCAFIIIVVMLILCGVDLFQSFWGDNELTTEAWKSIFPVITLALGYIFGKGERK